MRGKANRRKPCDFLDTSMVIRLELAGSIPAHPEFEGAMVWRA